MIVMRIFGVGNPNPNIRQAAIRIQRQSDGRADFVNVVFDTAKGQGKMKGRNWACKALQQAAAGFSSLRWA